MADQDHNRSASDRLGVLQLPFEYVGTITEDRHGLLLDDWPSPRSRTELHSVIGDVEPTPVIIEASRFDRRRFTYRGRVKVFREKLVLMDPVPSDPTAEWITLEDRLGLGFIEQYVRLRILP